MYLDTPTKNIAHKFLCTKNRIAKVSSLSFSGDYIGTKRKLYVSDYGNDLLESVEIEIIGKKSKSVCDYISVSSISSGILMADQHESLMLESGA